MQLQKSVSALQVDRSKSHTIFSIPWSISLALCWYSWSIADSGPGERTCNTCFSESCQQLQQILMSMKDNSNFLPVLTDHCIVISGFLPPPSLTPWACSALECQWLTIYLGSWLRGLAAAKGRAGVMPSGFYYFCLSLSHSLAAIVIPSHIFRCSHCHQGLESRSEIQVHCSSHSSGVWA